MAARAEPQHREVLSGGGAASFTEDLRLVGLAEAVEDSRVAAALEELAALQNLAALASWPQAHAAPAPVVRPAVSSALAPPPAKRAEPWTDATLAAAVFDAVNARRDAAGLPALTFDGRLAQAASSYALRMLSLNSFGHSVDGSTITSRLAAAGFTEPVMVGEVIAWSGGTASPASIVQMWIDSAVHREQILSPGYRIAGAGCAFGGGKVHCVLDLAG